MSTEYDFAELLENARGTIAELRDENARLMQGVEESGRHLDEVRRDAITARCLERKERLVSLVLLRRWFDVLGIQIVEDDGVSLTLQDTPRAMSVLSRVADAIGGNDV